MSKSLLQRAVFTQARQSLSYYRSQQTWTVTRCYSSHPATGDRLRVAVIGGGVSGLSTALHLAPLVRLGLMEGPIDVYQTDGCSGRDIGVGVWSTALDPFQESNEETHQMVYQDLIQHGCFVRDVGYRSPKGHWLATSRLDGRVPDLLFLREKDLVESLWKAAQVEQDKGTIAIHENSPVDAVFEESTLPWSAPLILQEGDTTRQSPKDYHLIVAADGMNSVLRRKYGGHICARGNYAPTGGSPLELEQDSGSQRSNWYVTGQAEATGVQDRDYTVFRGNAPLSMADLNLDKSFQTWGEGKSMRFATVPMLYPMADGTKEEHLVWFITIDDDEIIRETDPAQRQAKLLDAFADWHDPVGRLVEATPPGDILMERAVAHKHSMSPVANFNGVLAQIHHTQAHTAGNGPAIVFVGDAFMTVDPILAQGFTIGMEGAAALKTAVETTLTRGGHPEIPNLAFNPYALREDLKDRHDSRISRLIHLLRATELVQALGQPTTGTLLGWLSRDVIRPLMRFAPDFLKTPIFNYMLLYSLGSPPLKSAETNPPKDL